MRRGITEVCICQSEFCFIIGKNITQNVMLVEISITVNIYNRLIIIRDNKLNV